MPALRPGQVVVSDNLAALKGKRVQDLVEARGASLLFLPTYSPDFSPIEEAACTRETQIKAISKALDAVRPEDAKRWFVHCGYEAEP